MSARSMPTYWIAESLFHSRKSRSPTATVLTVRSVSTTAELTATPTRDVTSPNVMNTTGETRMTARILKN